MAWLSAPPARRTQLFRLGAWPRRRHEIVRAAPDELTSSLLILLDMFGGGDGVNGGDLEAISTTCQAIAGFAQQRGNPATRLAFTLLAALADPESAKLALETAKQARDLAEYAHAETWFRRAVRVARRSREWSTYLWGYIGLAILYMRVGNYPASRAVTLRVLRGARHLRSRSMEGTAFHQLFILDAEGNRMREAYENARAALHAWGGSHPRLTALAHDVARYWVEHGHFARALSVFESTLPGIHDAEEAAIALANTSWAASGTGDRIRYQQARGAAIDSLSRAGSQARAAEVYATLALADVIMGEIALARETADLALSIASRRCDADAQLLAERAVSAAQCDSRGDVAANGSEPAVLARQADNLAAELIRSLLASTAMVEQ